MPIKIVPPRVANIGQLEVKRLIPWREKRMCGPFIFLDHMGPHEISFDGSGDVLPHPHIGLSTLTWLLSGELMHRDSLGTVQKIEPGAVNWMTAGNGIVHSERSVPGSTATTMEGLQLWVALPEDKQNIAPCFQHLSKDQVPQWEEEGLHYQLIAGEWGEYKSSLNTHSDTLMLELNAQHQGTMELDFDRGFELGLYLIRGSVELHFDTSDQILETNQLLISDEGFSFSYSDDARFILLGGEQFPTVPNIWWNFVAFDKTDIEEAKRKWQAQLFDKVAGEDDFVPLPER